MNELGRPHTTGLRFVSELDTPEKLSSANLQFGVSLRASQCIKVEIGVEGCRAFDYIDEGFNHEPLMNLPKPETLKT